MVEITQVWDILGEKAVALAAHVRIWPKHEVVDNELLPTSEEFGKGNVFAISRVEDIVLGDLNHGKVAELSVDFGGGPSDFFPLKRRALRVFRHSSRVAI